MERLDSEGMEVRAEERWFLATRGLKEEEEEEEEGRLQCSKSSLIGRKPQATLPLEAAAAPKHACTFPAVVGDPKRGR